MKSERLRESDARILKDAADAPAGLARLAEIMERLRDPEGGCPWDVEQTFETIAPYTIEEAYEVADAIERGALPDLCEELGDLQLQVVYHARIAAERGDFTLTGRAARGQREDDPAPSACLRRCDGAAELGGDEGGGARA